MLPMPSHICIIIAWHSSFHSHSTMVLRVGAARKALTDARRDLKEVSNPPRGEALVGRLPATKREVPVPLPPSLPLLALALQLLGVGSRPVPGEAGPENEKVKAPWVSALTGWAPGPWGRGRGAGACAQ